MTTAIAQPTEPQTSEVEAVETVAAESATVAPPAITESRLSAEEIWFHEKSIICYWFVVIAWRVLRVQ